MQRKSLRRRVIRSSLLATNILILAVILFVVLETRSGSSLSQPSIINDPGETSAIANPLDQVSSADIALTVARMSSLPETTAITNQAQSQAADFALVTSNSDVTSKPQVLATALKSKADIQTYTTVAGDTVSSLAAKFGITSNSIRWSNGLSGDALTAGTKLLVPPVNGIVYTVKSGDTADSLASKYSADKAKIIAYNDAEISGLVVGEHIIIPDATQAAAPVATFASASFPWGGGAIYGYNGYDFGYCTWYVATQISVPANWGNASTWSYYAGLSGWNVSGAPSVGAIAQTPYAAGGEGHVGVVRAVSPDGRQVLVQDMNNYGDGGGWDRVGEGWVSTATYPHYITH